MQAWEAFLRMQASALRRRRDNAELDLGTGKKSPDPRKNPRRRLRGLGGGDGGAVRPEPLVVAEAARVDVGPAAAATTGRSWRRRKKLATTGRSWRRRKKSPGKKIPGKRRKESPGKDGKDGKKIPGKDGKDGKDGKNPRGKRIFSHTSPPSLPSHLVSSRLAPGSRACRNVLQEGWSCSGTPNLSSRPQPRAWRMPALVLLRKICVKDSLFGHWRAPSLQQPCFKKYRS